MIIAALISITLTTLAAWEINKISPIKFCSICAGVSIAWFWMLGAYFLGYEIDILIPAILMGGSTVGLAYQLEKRLKPHHSPLLWKALFIQGGFGATYGLVQKNILTFFAFLIFTVAVVVVFFYPGKADSGRRENEKLQDLEKKMKKCC